MSVEQRDQEMDRLREAISSRERHELDALAEHDEERANRHEAESRECSLKSELAEARQMLLDIVRYANEDRAITPGFTRLQRALDRVTTYLGVEQP